MQWAIPLACLQGCTFKLVTAIASDTTPPWDRVVVGPFVALMAMAVLAGGLVLGVVLMRGARLRLRLAGAALVIVSIVTNPFSAGAVADWLRPAGAVTLENWREHKELHASAAYADAVDHQGTLALTSYTRRFQCLSSEVRHKTMDVDPQGRLRCYSVADADRKQPTKWYYDEAGALRFVWDQAANQRTFLNARAEPLWSWWRGVEGGQAAYGLQLLRPEHVALRSAEDARARFDAPEPGCDEIR